jgi:hypothetical protein
VSQIAVALPYAVSIRDFVHSGALRALVTDKCLQLTIYTLNPELPELDAARSLGVQIKGMQPYDDTRIENLIKRIYPFFFADCFAYIAQSIERSTLRRLFAATCVSFRRLVGARTLLRIAGGLLTKLNRRRKLPRQLDPETELLIGTRSLINSLDYGLMAEAARVGIPIVTLAGSWDNFTTKGYFPFPVVKTVVWNQKMCEELIEFFAVPPQLIDIAGYPRAALLGNHACSVDAQAYLNELNIEGCSRFVLYSASYSELTRVPNQPMPLEYMAIREVCETLSQQLPNDTCILIRLHPFSRHEDEACFEGLKRCFVFAPGRQDRYVERVMNEADERHLALQINQSVCIVSMASTMSIDAMCLKKPIINVAFDPLPMLLREHSIKRFYEYNHFRDLVRIVRLPLAEQVSDVIAFVHDCLAGLHRSNVDYGAFEKMYVDKTSNLYPQRVCASVKEALKS